MTTKANLNTQTMKTSDEMVTFALTMEIGQT